MLYLLRVFVIAVLMKMIFAWGVIGLFQRLLAGAMPLCNVSEKFWKCVIFDYNVATKGSESIEPLH